MKVLSEYLDDALRTWLGSSLAGCCGASISKHQEPLRAEKCLRIEHCQPRLIPPPAFPDFEDRTVSRNLEWVTRSRSFASRASSRGSFSVRRRLHAYNGFNSGRPSRKISIGAPQDFRHVDNALPRRAPMFRPLELSIYMPGDAQLSPILPHFKPGELSFPIDDFDGSEYAPTHSRSGSSLSFRIPRKPLRASSRASSEWTAHFKPRPESLSAQELLAALESELPRAPMPARLRALTAPPAYERVKSALHEKYELERQLRDIDEVIEERQSIYFNSRPVSRATTATDRPASITSVYEESQEPMPVVLPTFAQRALLPLADQRPRTAPSKAVHIPTRHKSFTEASAAFSKPQPPLPSKQDLPPPPPLPMMLAQPPPLRKKKSFSRVSNWLFPDTHSRNISLDSVTNNPKPVARGHGFYQCVELKNTVSTVSVSTVSTMESELDAPTIPTTWSPQSTPGGFDKRDVVVRTFSMDSEVGAQDKSLELTRLRTFGEKEEETWRLVVPMPVVPGRNSVGVAF